MRRPADGARVTPDFVFAGGGDMGALCRAHDWGGTPLGAVGGWTQSLRTMVGAVLNSRNPMLLFWGPELVQFYNDAFRPSLGDDGRRHPAALGACGRAFWSDVWDTIGPQVDGVMSRGDAVWFEDRHLPIDRNGRREDVWWTYSYSPVRDDDGSIGGTLVVCLEVTKQVRARAEIAAAEQRLRDVVEQTTLAVAVLEGPDHVYSLVSPRYAAFGGARQYVGRPIAEVLSELRPSGIFDVIDRVYRTGEPYVESERAFLLDRDRDGVPEPYVFDVGYLPLRDAAGQVYAIASVTTDVTAHVTARRALESAQVRLQQALLSADAARQDAERARTAAEEASRAKSEFLATMSHELRTPLNAIGGYVELMEMGIRGPVTSEQRADLARIRASQRHLLGLINEVLNYAKLETGAVRFDLEAVRADDALRAAEALVVPHVRAKGLALTVAPPPPDVVVRADREKLQQILLNLLSNAVKFTPAGGEIALGASAEGDVVRLRVRDTGIGIPADKLESVFEPFVQVRGDLTRTADGTGLGLAISRDLARGMGGDLTVESAVGVGSAFVLALPPSTSA